VSKKWGLPVIALTLLGWTVWNVFGGNQPRRIRQPEGLARSSFVNRVAGVGLVEPRTDASGRGTVAVGTELPGIVTKVFVKNQEYVKKDQPLFALDDRAKKAELAVKLADLEMAEKVLTKLEKSPRSEEIPPYEARVAQARADLEMAEDALSRGLQARIATPPEQVVRLQQGVESTRQKWEEAKQNLALLNAGTWEPDLAVARAKKAQAKAAVDQVNTDLERQVVRAPFEGQVLQVNVRLGEWVSTERGKALVMMGDVQELYVRAAIDESDIARFQEGAPAEAKTRGTPQHTLKLRFVRIEPYVTPKQSLSGDNIERVDTRVLQVIYAINEPNPPAKIATQVDVFIKVGDAKDETKEDSYPET
jgi:HlyD family secretion protein